MNRQRPKRSDATIEDLTLIVRPPGRPMDIQTFTDLERADAEAYASATGAVVEPLPLPYPESYRGPTD
jgi:hypothetical protein